MQHVHKYEWVLVAVLIVEITRCEMHVERAGAERESAKARRSPMETHSNLFDDYSNLSIARYSLSRCLCAIHTIYD